MKRITSVHNQVVSEIIKLNNAKHRKSSKLFYVEGYKLTSELIKSGFLPIYCFISESADHSKIPLGINDENIYVVSEQILKKISAMTTPPEILTVAKEKDISNQYSLDDCIVALDCIQDPSNLGAIFRSAEAFGIKTILLGNGCSDAFSAKNLRSAMGSTFRLNVINVSLEDELQILKDKGYTVIGTGLDRNYKTVDKLSDYKKKIIVIGNEGNGISNGVNAYCDFGMFIPMTGQNESLNAAVAASIILWENQRQNYETK